MVDFEDIVNGLFQLAVVVIVAVLCLPRFYVFVNVIYGICCLDGFKKKALEPI